MKLRWLSAALVFITGCSSTVQAISTPAAVPPATATLVPQPTATITETLTVRLTYPKADTEIKMGQNVTMYALVTDAQGSPVSDAALEFTVRDPSGQTVATVTAIPRGEGTYKAAPWMAPHRSKAGPWPVTIRASTATAEGEGQAQVPIQNSTSEDLLAKYGFWLDPPSLKGIQPAIMAERGDAQNGMVRWGGIVPSQHVMPTSIAEIQWRHGDHHLDSPEAVHRFMLSDIGDLGFTPVRALGPYEPTKFKRWDAWHVGARGQFQQDLVDYMVFYAPEVDKTFVIGTTVDLPPAGIDPHDTLRRSFEVHPEVQAQGQAAERLPNLLPAPELLSPELGERFTGRGQPILLRWQPVKDLAPGEYYQVAIDYNYIETNPGLKLATTDTQVTLPENLYSVPNCHVFNWQVTLMRKVGEDANGQPKGEPLSHASLYSYLQWLYPPDEKQPFPAICPNAQF